MVSLPFVLVLDLIMKLIQLLFRGYERNLPCPSKSDTPPYMTVLIYDPHLVFSLTLPIAIP